MVAVLPGQVMPTWHCSLRNSGHCNWTGRLRGCSRSESWLPCRLPTSAAGNVAASQPQLLAGGRTFRPPAPAITCLNLYSSTSCGRVFLKAGHCRLMEAKLQSVRLRNAGGGVRRATAAGGCCCCCARACWSGGTAVAATAPAGESAVGAKREGRVVCVVIAVLSSAAAGLLLFFATTQMR